MSLPRFIFCEIFIKKKKKNKIKLKKNIVNCYFSDFIQLNNVNFNITLQI